MADADLEEFLAKVDQIESIVKGLNSSDEKVVKESFLKSDKLVDENFDKTENIITKTGFNKTFINKSQTDPVKPLDQGATDQESFMKILEQDANERHARKQKAIKEATDLKLKGNEQFKIKAYEKAVEFYSEAIRVLKDNTVIYTNRAQCYIHLNQYEEAIKDCEWALKVDARFIKAYIHKGRALVCLKRFDEAFNEFTTAKKYADLASQRTIDDYLKELERCRNTEIQIKSVEEFLKSGESNDVVGIMDELNKIKNNNLLYYSGGLRALGKCVKDGGLESRTLFRIRGGFGMIEEHGFIGKCFSERLDEVVKDPLKIELFMSVLELLEVACEDCDENVKCVFALTKFSEKCLVLLDMSGIGKDNQIEYPIQGLKIGALSLLKLIGLREYGVEQMCANFNLNKLIQGLLKLGDDLREVNEKESSILKTSALQVLQNLALDQKFQARLKLDQVGDELLPGLLKTIKTYETDIYIQSLAYTILYSLTSRPNVRSLVISSEQTWTQATASIVRLACKMSSQSEPLVQTILSLLINMSTIRKTGPVVEHSSQLIQISLKFLDFKTEIVLKLIGNLIQSDPSQARNYAHLDKNFIHKLIDRIKCQHSAIDQCLKVLALCTGYSSLYCNMIENPSLLYELFKGVSQSVSENGKVNLKKLNETRINNGVLVMSNCVSASEKFSESLSKTDIMMDLLYLARDGLNKEMQKNCGILIARLCKTCERHLVRLRELHGVEILHQALKNVDL